MPVLFSICRSLTGLNEFYGGYLGNKMGIDLKIGGALNRGANFLGIQFLKPDEHLQANFQGATY